MSHPHRHLAAQGAPKARVRTCSLALSLHGCLSPSPFWEGHITFISLLIILPALDVVILGKDREGQGRRDRLRCTYHDRGSAPRRGRVKAWATAFTCKLPPSWVATQMTLVYPSPASCLPFPLNPCPESLPASPINSLFLPPSHTGCCREEVGAKMQRERRRECKLRVDHMQRSSRQYSPPPPRDQEAAAGHGKWSRRRKGERGISV